MDETMKETDENTDSHGERANISSLNLLRGTKVKTLFPVEFTQQKENIIELVRNLRQAVVVLFGTYENYNVTSTKTMEASLCFKVS